MEIHSVLFAVKILEFLETFCSKDLSKLPSIYVRPVVLKDATGEEIRESNNVYECPVFMNRARQVSPATLPLSSSISPDKWIMAGTAIILDPGTIYC